MALRGRHRVRTAAHRTGVAQGRATSGSRAESRRTMATARLSQLQQQILRWLVADHQRTRGMMASRHQELVRALNTDNGNLSHSLHTLETHGLLVIARSPGGHAESIFRGASL